MTIITAPLYYLAERWKREDQAIQGRMARDLKSIKAHYTGQKRFYLIRNVHRMHGYTPLQSLKTSFGLFIQIPFFFAAYNYLSRFQGYVGAGFLFIDDLGRPDHLLWGVNALPFVMTALAFFPWPMPDPIPTAASFSLPWHRHRTWTTAIPYLGGSPAALRWWNPSEALPPVPWTVR